ncbi:DUF2726 domain-containing protein [Curvivirga aplysinae]|uniref:DUF2726 domain-containing protein n=1 Tax=Curvivirga aplysinae TaxID=2529852 RepID=UPI0012BC6568|nr:DUF2726 domain-containing protein [Curvivirga aplysinae]MTI08240.1 DUF2726 domain-containing protein [Curvivirga aplysinae]
MISEFLFYVFIGLIIPVGLFRLLSGGNYADEHLRLVKKGKIFAQPLMNKSEMRLYTELRNWQRASGKTNLNLFSQVSMGEILATVKEETRRSFNAKRLDFLFVDQDAMPCIAIEYQGQGHFGDDAKQKKQVEKRDKVKRLALEKAGIVLVEIFPEDR